MTAVIMIRTVSRAGYRAWWRACPAAIPLFRVSAGILAGLVPLAWRGSAVIAGIAGMAAFACSMWAVWSGLRRHGIRNRWVPWEP